MAISQTHFRSISLPSRLHPTNLETELEKLKSRQVSGSSEAIQSGLVRIAELYNSLEEITQSPNTQKSALLEKSILEESLSSSVELLDACGAIRELFETIKENAHALQSAVRRKGQEYSSVQNEIAAYFCCRKKMTKSIAKTLRNLKKLSRRMMIENGSDLSVHRDSNCTSVFRELTGITIAIFRSVLVFLSSPTARHGGWSLVSKLMITRAGGENHHVAVNEVGNVDFALTSLQKMRSNGATVLDVQKRLQNLDAAVEGFEAGLERLFRQLVRIRVTLLNILTHH